jgi:hypothetical protein
MNHQKGNNIAPAEFCSDRRSTQENKMKLLIIGAALGATLLGALPASAEVVVRENGVVVRTDNGYHQNNSYHRSYASCRVIKVRKHLPNGNVIIKTRRVC